MAPNKPGRDTPTGITLGSMGQRARRRRGALAIVVVICLVLVAMFCATLFRVSLARREQVRGEEYRLQAAWLAESGLERAAARLAESPAYPGETWRIAPDELGGQGAAVVAIAVEADPSRPDRRRVRAQADFPADSRYQARASQDIVIDLQTETQGEGEDR
ncbi:MAG: hypothetical protein IRY99_15630 [Isosphaeraceae bacterium]|nr:hypothetical protein [Isosphaeraceae bacterium]